MAAAHPPKDVLFMTSAEHGQANVVLAVALEVGLSPDFQVHIAANVPMQDRLVRINRDTPSLAHPIKFHCLPGLSMQEVAARRYGGNDISGNAHPPGFWSAIKSYKALEAAILGWEPSEYLEIYSACLETIQRVNPAALICDISFWQAHDAARALEVQYITMAPCGAKEVVGGELPGAPMLVKWPATGSGFKYPLSFVNVLRNVVLTLCFIIAIIQGRYYKGIVKARKQADLKHDFPMLKMWRKEGLYLIPYLPEADFGDFKNIPANTIGCGPIVLPPQPVKSDEKLWTWLQQKPTVLINLGTHFGVESHTIEMAKGIKMALSARPDIQILWKLKYDWKANAEVTRIVSRLVDSDQLRIVPWLDVNPSSLLDHVAAAVHHGGANSYYECCRVGVPQLVLPIWWDCYEFAERIRYLGIGLIGNVGYAPGVEASSFSTALVRVLGEASFKSNAESLAAACRKRGEGREIAAKEVVEWAHLGQSKLLSLKGKPT